MAGGIGFSFREGKRRRYNALGSKKILQSVTDATLNIRVCLEIPIAKRVNPVVLVAYVISYNRKNVVY